MTLRKLALGSALGMLASGLGAYLLPLPQASPPAPAPSSAPSSSTTPDGAPTPTERASHLAEMEQEIARLRALLDAGPDGGSAAAPDDARTSAQEDATPTPTPREDASPKDLPQDRSQYAPAPPSPPTPVSAMPDLAPDSCRVPMSAEQFAALARTFPSVRQLPPDKTALLKSASPACTCGVAPGSFARCQSWCRSQGYSPEKATCDQYQRCHCLEDY